jgi:ABC-type polysaccharide/polyol phosphate export permease
MIAPAKIKIFVLLLASSTIFLVASLYGVFPYWFASAVLGISEPYHNLAHVLRAMMCLYFGFGFYWLFAAFNTKYRNPALLTVMLFPAGLVTGRIISLFADGKPSPLLLFYMAAELVQVPIAYWAFRLPD